MIVLHAPGFRALGVAGPVEHEAVHGSGNIPIALLDLGTAGLGGPVHPGVHVLHRNGEVFGEDRERCGQFRSLGVELGLLGLPGAGGGRLANAAVVEG